MLCERERERLYERQRERERRNSQLMQESGSKIILYLSTQNPHLATVTYWAHENHTNCNKTLRRLRVLVLLLLFLFYFVGLFWNVWASRKNLWFGCALTKAGLEFLFVALFMWEDSTMSQNILRSRALVFCISHIPGDPVSSSLGLVIPLLSWHQTRK